MRNSPVPVECPVPSLLGEKSDQTIKVTMLLLASEKVGVCMKDTHVWLTGVCYSAQRDNIQPEIHSNVKENSER